MRTAILFLFLAALLPAQIRMATTEDGSVLYFSTPARTLDSGQTFHFKIFRWDAANGVKLVAEERDEGEMVGCTWTKFFHLHDPQVSADGSVFGYTASRPYQGSRYCDVPDEVDRAVAGSLNLPGSLLLSRNGRYAVTTPSLAASNGFHLVTNLLTRQTVPADGVAQEVTDDGTTVERRTSAVALTDRNSVTRIVTTTQTVSEATINRAGTTVVYNHSLGPDLRPNLATVDVANNRETRLGGGFAISNLRLTSDGLTLFYTDVEGGVPRQVFSMGIGGSNGRQITREPAGISDYLVSGDGRVVFAISRSRLLRVDAATGNSTDLTGVIPLISDMLPGYDAPIGSPVHVLGTPVDAVQKITVCGEDALIVKRDVQFTDVQFQVPWDVADKTCAVVVQTASTFEIGRMLSIVTSAPAFAGGCWRDGSILSCYMTGLGPLGNSGMVVGPFGCSLSNVAAEVTYVGAAPGYPAYNQVNIRVPAGLSGRVPLACGFDTANIARAEVNLN